MTSNANLLGRGEEEEGSQKSLNRVFVSKTGLGLYLT